MLFLRTIYCNLKKTYFVSVFMKCHFYFILGAQLEKLMEQLRSELETNPPLPGAFTPRSGDLCAAKFIDGQWYRAKIEKVAGGTVSIFYIDYGNVRTVLYVLNSIFFLSLFCMNHFSFILLFICVLQECAMRLWLKGDISY